MRPKAFSFYLDYIVNLQDLTKEQVGELVLSLLHYANTWEDGIGDVPEMDLIVKVAFAPIRKQLDIEFTNYDKKSKTNSANVQKRWERVKKDTEGYEEVREDTKQYESIRPYQNDKDKDKDKDKEKERRKKGSNRGETDLPFYPLSEYLP